MTDTEKKVFDVWAEVFERDNFGIDEDFFEIGGDSMKAMKIYMRLTENIAEVNIDDFSNIYIYYILSFSTMSRQIIKNSILNN